MNTTVEELKKEFNKGYLDMSLQVLNIYYGSNEVDRETYIYTFLDLNRVREKMDIYLNDIEEVIEE
jgi:hypothetical protein